MLRSARPAQEPAPVWNFGAFIGRLAAAAGPPGPRAAGASRSRRRKDAERWEFGSRQARWPAGRALRRRPGDGVSLFAVDDSPPVAGPRARSPRCRAWTSGPASAARRSRRGSTGAVPGSVSGVRSGGCHAVRVRFARDRSGPCLEDFSSWTPGAAPLLPGVAPARPVQPVRLSGTAGPARAIPALVVRPRVPVMFFVFVPVESSFPSRCFADFGVAWCEPVRACPVSSCRPPLRSTYPASGDDAVGLYLVQPIGCWRQVDPDCGQPVFVCPACWPAVRRVLPRGRAVTVRQVVPRPRWAQCAVCDPDPVC